MEHYRKSYITDVQSRIAGSKISQLAMAAPLESGPSSTKSKASTPVGDSKRQTEEKEPPSQKAALLMCLLSVGALKPAICILSKFPWLVDVHPEIADLMIRVMKLSLSPLYEQHVGKEKNSNYMQPRARWGSTGVSHPPPRRPQLTLWAPTPPSTSITEFVFFYPDWRDQVPICASLDDLADVIEPLIRFIGLHVSRDPLFLTEYLRLGRLQLQGRVRDH